MDSQMTQGAPMMPQSTAKGGNNIVWILVGLAVLALIMFFAFAKKQANAPVTSSGIDKTLDAGAQVELKSTSNSVQAIDQDYKAANPSNLDAGI